MVPSMQYSLILDIGKTHIKLSVLTPDLRSVATREARNRVLTPPTPSVAGDSATGGAPSYPQVDERYIWAWITGNLRELTAEFPIARLNITTHGATAACIRAEGSADTTVEDPLQDSGLALPILDYEYEGIHDDPTIANAYRGLRPPFAETFSPALPAGLNLGRQLHWLANQYPDAFANTRAIVMYPQYWLWRLTGVLCNEVTSLGCHTDLWNPGTKTFSSLVENMQWQQLFPNMVSATQKIARPTPQICALTGLAADCEIFAGVHDSNASYWRHRVNNEHKPFTVISTGTWSIVMAKGADLSSLVESRDMLANVDAAGDPIACARFMGGREYEAICKHTDSPLDQSAAAGDTSALVSHYLRNRVMALPTFSRGGGPFAKLQGQLKGDIQPGTGAIVASLYCALMLDYQLTAINCRGDIIIEGAFLKNPLLCGLLAQLRAPQQLLLSEDDTGTVTGCAILASGNTAANIPLTPCDPYEYPELLDYRRDWLQWVQAAEKDGAYPQPTVAPMSRDGAITETASA